VILSLLKGSADPCNEIESIPLWPWAQLKSSVREKSFQRMLQSVIGEPGQWRHRSPAARARRCPPDAKAADLAPIIKELRVAGKTSLSAIAAGLNDAGVLTARGAKLVAGSAMLERLDPLHEEEAAAA
jgi:hypothetical protein